MEMSAEVTEMMKGTVASRDIIPSGRSISDPASGNLGLRIA
jgi:hypothetical protein